MMQDTMDLRRRIENAAASQEVENVHATHCYFHAASRSKEEWSTIWTRRDDCSWAHGFGRMRGFDEVWKGSVSDYDVMAYKDFIKLRRVYPQVGGKDPRPLMVCSMHTMTTGVVEVAEDGQSARAAFLTPGTLFSNLNADQKKDAMTLWERYGADFIYENGRWLYLHEQVCPDYGMPLFDSVDLAHETYLREISDKKPEPPQPEPGEDEQEASGRPHVSDPGPLHLEYSPFIPTQNTVPYPLPYKTLNNSNTYTKCDCYED